MTTGALARGGLWVLAFLPPALALRSTLALASPAPEPQTWRSIWGEEPLALSWGEALAFTDEPNDLAFRAVHLLLLDTLGLDSGRIAILSWLLAGAAVAAITLLASRSGAGRTATPVVALAVGAAAWAPAYGADWLLGERFRVFVPGVATVVGTLLLASPRPPPEGTSIVGSGFRRRFLAAGVLAAVALFSERTGALTWIALAPLIPAAARARGYGRPAAALALWCLLGCSATALRCDESAATVSARTGVLGDLASDPAATGHFLLEAAGLGLPDVSPGRFDDGQVMGAAWLGAAGLLILLSVHFRGRGRALQALPWMALVVHGAGSALLLAESFHPAPIPAIYLRELTWAGFLLPAGTCGIAAVMFPRAARFFLAAVILAFLSVSVPDWETGFRKMGLEYRLLRQGEAALAWSLVASPVSIGMTPAPLSNQRAVGLHLRGGLRRSPFESSTEIAADGPLPVLPRCGGIKELSGRTASGEVVDRPDGLVPDAVVLTRRKPGGADTVFRICSPDVFTGGDPRPWLAEFAEAAEFAEDEEVRALGYDARRGRAFRLHGRFVVRGGRFEPAPEDRP